MSPTVLDPADREAPDATGPPTPLTPPAATDARVAAADLEPPASESAELEAPTVTPALPTEALPPGTLEVVVTVNGVPRTEGVVILDDSRPGAGGWPSIELKPGGAHGGRERRLDERGRAVFQDVSAGEWWLAVSATAGHAQQSRCTMPEGEGHRVEVKLTSGAVYGDAYDDEGAPIVDAWVALTPTAGTSQWQFTRTGVDGAYRMEFVRPGETWIQLIPGEALLPNRSVGPMQKLDVPRSGDLRHDFGALGGLRTWRGRVVTRAGTPPVVAATLHLQHKDDGRYVAVKVTAGTGAFEHRLGRGTWSVRVDDQLHPGQRQQVLDLEIAEADVESEVVWPGTRLVVELSGAVDPPPTWVSLREPASKYILWKAAADGEHQWVFDGVQGGEWLLTIGDRSGTLAERLVVTRDLDAAVREPVVLPPR
ncbi:MAG: hypothetical protein R3F49_18695 [Planctomycetota bacterium]